MHDTLHILVVAPAPFTHLADPLAASLQPCARNIETSHADTPESVATAMARQAWHLVIGIGSDAGLGLVRAHDPDVAFVLVCSTVDGRQALQHLRRGCDEVVLAGDLEALPDAVTQALGKADARRALKALLRSEHRFRLASSTGQVWDWDIKNQSSYVAPAFFHGLGYPDVDPADPMALFRQLMHPEDMPRLQQALRGHLTQRQPYAFDYRARAATGEYRWFHTDGQAEWDAAGQACYMAGTVFDITEAKHAQAAVQRERLFSASMIESMPGILYFYDEQGRFLRWNQNFATVSGYSAVEIARMHPLDFFCR